jgi:hypothetical protein
MAKLTFVEFCDRYGIETRTTGDHTRRGWVQIDCPYCNPNSKKFHMGFNLAWPSLNCWRCGKKKIKQTLQLLTGLTEPQLHGIINSFPREKSIDVEDKRGKFNAPAGVKPMLKKHKQFLRDRDFNPDRIANVWGVMGLGVDGGCKRNGKWFPLPWRLYIPIEVGSKLSSWTTRTVFDYPNITRYISSPPEHERINHKELLYGEDYAGQTIIIVEGPTDAWRIGPGAVATFGTRPTPSQIVRMGRYVTRYVCFDHNAENYAQLLRERLAVYPGVTHIITLDADDPGSMGSKELRQVRKLLT